jgi:hypothetical protein
LGGFFVVNPPSLKLGWTKKEVNNMSENGSNHAPEGAQHWKNGSRDILVDADVVTATNRVIEARKAAPGGDLHEGEMINLVEMLANTPGAVDSLIALQNPNAK